VLDTKILVAEVPKIANTIAIPAIIKIIAIFAGDSVRVNNIKRALEYFNVIQTENGCLSKLVFCGNYQSEVKMYLCACTIPNGHFVSKNNIIREYGDIVIHVL
jgi:hypothetical protein